jgi:hypothetical protein
MTDGECEVAVGMALSLIVKVTHAIIDGSNAFYDKVPSFLVSRHCDSALIGEGCSRFVIQQ